MALVGMVMLMSLALPATAGTGTKSGSTAVSCEPSMIKDVTNVTHSAGGTLSVKQNGSSPVSSTYVTGRSSNGNQLSWRLVSNGTTASWTGVWADTYTIRAP